MLREKERELEKPTGKVSCGGVIVLDASWQCGFLKGGWGGHDLLQHQQVYNSTER